MRTFASAALVLLACTQPPVRLRDLPACGAPTTGAWDERFHLPGVDGPRASVAALARLGDGSIAVGGWFERAAGAAARNVARWDGAAWYALADGLPPVAGLTVDDAGTLWAAGTNDAPLQTSYLARWDGTGWTMVVDDADATIRGVTAVAAGIVVFGDFQHLAGITASGMAMWDGVSWRDVGLAEYSAITAVVRTANGYCVGGGIWLPGALAPYDGAACRDATAWGPLGAPMPGWPVVLGLGPDGTWWAGGGLQWDSPDGTDVIYGVGSLAADGTWQPLDGGVRGSDPFFPSAEAEAIAFEGDSILFGGNFSTVGPDRLASGGLARWSPRTGWESVAGNTVGWRSPYDGVFVSALLRDGSNTHVGGAFDAVGATPAANVATIGENGTVSAWTGGAVLLGATGIADLATTVDLDLVATGIVTAGSFVGARAATLGDGWTAVAEDPPIFHPSRIATRSDGSIVLADDVIVAWDGTAWTTLAPSGSPSPLLVDSDDAIYYQSTVGASSEIKRIDAAGVTSSLGTVPGTVVALAVFDGALVAIANIEATDGSVTVSIMIDTDDGWQSIDGAPQAAIVDAEWSPSLGLVVTSRNAVVAWDGTSWRTLGSATDDGIFTSATVCADGLFTAEYRFGDPGTSTLQFTDGNGPHPVATLSWAGDLALGRDGLYVTGSENGESWLALWRYPR